MRSYSKIQSITSSLVLLLAPLMIAGELENKSVDIDGMVLIPAGEFIMGSTREDKQAKSDEMPQRKVYLKAYYIDRFEVSNIEYKNFLKATGAKAPDFWVDGEYQEDADWYPVALVSWWEAKAYAKWVGKRLPTEAEWEKAARGTDGRRFPWGQEFDAKYANAGTDGYMPVNAKLEGASPYGVMNMAGNVAEWTETVYEAYPELEVELPSEFGGVTPLPKSKFVELGRKGSKKIYDDDERLQFFSRAELSDGRHRVFRGGSINNFTQFLRTTNRQRAKPGSRWYNIGFRCAVDVEDSLQDTNDSKNK